MKMMKMKEKVGGMMDTVSNILTPSQLGTMMGGSPDDTFQNIFEQIEQFKQSIDKVNAQFKDSTMTTFVAVCIPEFLSLYETERLVVELTKFEIDISNIVVN